jgi:nitric oxide reductase activation protein
VVSGVYQNNQDLIHKVRRQFQRIRPEWLNMVRGVDWGQEFYWPTLIRSVVERKAGVSPTERVFARREKKQRKISILFLIDMSASTDEQVPCRDRGRKQEKRIIDIEIESLVVMMEALDAFSDEYSIYGFSGDGRGQVDFYRVKDFTDPYSERLKQRIGGIEPQRSTRMGAAIRHAVQKMMMVDSDQRLLILLSDGFPQDSDYGEDRSSNEYGLQDTMMALIEARREGIRPFCITVDQAGNDYLKKMCDPNSYLVIQDVYGLPETMPKIVASLMIG